MDSSKFPTILLGIMAVIYLSSFSTSASHPRFVSKGENIKLDPQDPKVVEAANFAVDEYNRSAPTKLDFLGVIVARRQDLNNGCQYTITVQAYNGVIGVYVATIKEQASGAKQLVDFQKVDS